MLGVKTVLALAIAAQSVFGNPIRARTPYAVKETHYAPRKWTNIGRAPADHVVHLQIGVKQGQFDELERHLYEGMLSDPDHHRYGQHLSVDDVNELIKPSDESLDLVHEWLLDNGIGMLDYSPSKDWVNVALPVKAIERLLATEYSVFEADDGTKLVRTTEWSLPVHLHDHIDTIQPTTSFYRGQTADTDYVTGDSWVDPDYKQPTNDEIAKVCNVTSVTPLCFRTLYGTLGYKVKVPTKNKVSFTNYLGTQIPIRPDTAQFLAKYRRDAFDGNAAYAFPQISIAGGPVQDGPLNFTQAAEGFSQEANLDVQAILGISYPTSLISYSTGGSPPFIPDINTPTNTNEPYLVWVQYMLGLKTVPQVVSTSYGDDEQTVPKAYAERVCKSFAQLGARGVSLLFASGDRGVGLNATCFTNDGKNKYQFLPSFPASCPYVTTVGATHNFEPEVVAFRPGLVRADGSYREIYSSGSGFSNYFEAPKYQKKVTTEYIKNLKGKFDGLYNKAGRGYPDISAQGQNFAYFWNGTEGTISGTSASTPLMSGIIALVNDALVSSGKPALGFLNPFIYKSGYKGFTDIISGSGVGCQTEGFPATPGWDPVTGFGTPIFSELVKLAIEACK